MVDPGVQLLEDEGHPVDVEEQQHLHPLLELAELLITSQVLHYLEAVLPPAVAVDGLPLGKLILGLLLLEGQPPLLLVELLAPPSESYPVVTLILVQNVLDDLGVLLAQLIGLGLPLLD